MIMNLFYIILNDYKIKKNNNKTKIIKGKK